MGVSFVRDWLPNEMTTRACIPAPDRFRQLRRDELLFSHKFMEVRPKGSDSRELPSHLPNLVQLLIERVLFRQ